MPAHKCPKCGVQIEVEIQLTARWHPMQTDQPKPSAFSDDLGELIEAAESQSMTAWEADFLKDMKARYAQYGERTKVSEKQMAALRKIANGIPD